MQDKTESKTESNPDSSRRFALRPFSTGSAKGKGASSATSGNFTSNLATVGLFSALAACGGSFDFSDGGSSSRGHHYGRDGIDVGRDGHDYDERDEHDDGERDNDDDRDERDDDDGERDDDYDGHRDDDDDRRDDGHDDDHDDDVIPSALRFDGSDGVDTFYGSDASELIYGNGGADWLYGKDGDDWISGGAGDDFIWGGLGNDLIIGGSGIDFLYGEAGRDVIHGGDGNDFILGGDGDDTLDGGAGTNSIYGNAGADKFYLYGDASTVNGIDIVKDFSRSQGDKILIYGGALTFADLTVDNSGQHAVVTGYGSAGDRMTVENTDLEMSDFIFENPFHGRPDVIQPGGISFNAFVQTTYPVRGLRYTEGDDETSTLYIREGNNLGHTFGNLTASGAGDAITYSIVSSSGFAYGDGTSDDVADYFSIDSNGTLKLASGKSLNFGDSDPHASDDKHFTVTVKAISGAYSDTHEIKVQLGDYYKGASEPVDGAFHASVGDDLLKGSAKNDAFYGYEGNDELYGFSGNDALYGGAGDDHLDGGERDDTLYGGADDDTIIGGRGDDILYGGEGSDMFRFSGVDFSYSSYNGNDVIKDFSRCQGDKIQIASAGLLNFSDLYISYSNGNALVMGYGDLHGSRMTLEGWGGTDAATTLAPSDFILRLISWYDTPPDQGYIEGAVRGGHGDDTLYGDPDRDVGRDVLYGLSGHDSIKGGNGNDYLSGDSGNDVLYGSSGNDELYGGSGHDSLYGGHGDDYLNGGSGDDYLVGNAGYDTLYGGSGADKFTVYGDADRYSSSDTVKDFNRTEGDKIVIYSGGLAYSDITIDYSSGDALVTGYGAAGSQMTLDGWDGNSDATRLVETDFLFT